MGKGKSANENKLAYKQHILIFIILSINVITGIYVHVLMGSFLKT